MTLHNISSGSREDGITVVLEQEQQISNNTKVSAGGIGVQEDLWRQSLQTAEPTASIPDSQVALLLQQLHAPRYTGESVITAKDNPVHVEYSTESRVTNQEKTLGVNARNAAETFVGSLRKAASTRTDKPRGKTQFIRTLSLAVVEATDTAPVVDTERAMLAGSRTIPQALNASTARVMHEGLEAAANEVLEAAMDAVVAETVYSRYSGDVESKLDDNRTASLDYRGDERVSTAEEYRGTNSDSISVSSKAAETFATTMSMVTRPSARISFLRAPDCPIAGSAFISLDSLKSPTTQKQVTVAVREVLARHSSCSSSVGSTGKRGAAEISRSREDEEPVIGVDDELVRYQHGSRHNGLVQANLPAVMHRSATRSTESGNACAPIDVDSSAATSGKQDDSSCYGGNAASTDSQGNAAKISSSGQAAVGVNLKHDDMVISCVLTKNQQYQRRRKAYDDAVALIAREKGTVEDRKRATAERRAEAKRLNDLSAKEASYFEERRADLVRDQMAVHAAEDHAKEVLQYRDKLEALANKYDTFGRQEEKFKAQAAARLVQSESRTEAARGPAAAAAASAVHEMVAGQKRSHSETAVSNPSNGIQGTLSGSGRRVRRKVCIQHEMVEIQAALTMFDSASEIGLAAAPVNAIGTNANENSSSTERLENERNASVTAQRCPTAGEAVTNVRQREPVLLAPLKLPFHRKQREQFLRVVYAHLEETIELVQTSRTAVEAKRWWADEAKAECDEQAAKAADAAGLANMDLIKYYAAVEMENAAVLQHQEAERRAGCALRRCVAQTANLKHIETKPSCFVQGGAGECAPRWHGGK